ncbi:MAG: FAD-dependent oxidoreductase [Pseudomonadota bacterium]
MASRKRPRVAVIGAGLAGLTAARTLAAAGCAPLVLEKSRGVGGRMASRRPFGPEHPLAIDHGAPCVSALDWAAADPPGYDAAAHALVGWPAATSAHAAAAVGAPAMTAPARALAQGLDIRLERAAAAVTRAADGWRVALRAPDGAETVGPFEAVALAVPAPQARALAGAHAPAEATDAEMTPCWSALAAFAPGDDPAPPADAYLAHPVAPIALQVETTAKPGRRRDAGAAFTLYATPEWSAARLELEKPAAAQALFDAAREAAGWRAAPVHLAGHRWRLARTSRAAGSPFWLAPGGDFGVCGDWRLGPDAAHAVASGRALGDAMAARLARSG